jgi:undecaprenyl-diphosphatase
MDVLDALALGVIEGLTEFLPVSSTGHLLVAQRLLGIPESPQANAFAICIQAGAVAAVLLLYAGRARQLALGIAGRDPVGRRIARDLAVAFAPAAVLGAAFDEAIERELFGAWPVVVAWIAGGLAILLWERRPARRRGGARGLEALGAWRALAIGLAQCLAMWPGTSRSLVTILAAALVGLSLPAAIEFSFLLGVLTLGAATAYKGLQHGALMLETFGALPLLAGFLSAALAAVAAVRWMVAWLSGHGLLVFAWWRLLAGGAVAAALWAGAL